MAITIRAAEPTITWAQLAQRTGLKPETVRRAVREARHRSPSGPTLAPSADAAGNAGSLEEP